MSAFFEGYEEFTKLYAANSGSRHASQYTKEIEVEIDKLLKAINDPNRKIDNTSIEQLKGFIAEWWHTGTFNINAAVKGVKTRAYAPDDNGLVDIFVNGEGYSVKYSKYGNNSAAQQAKTNLERYKEYCSQYKRNHDGQE